MQLSFLSIYFCQIQATTSYDALHNLDNFLKIKCASYKINTIKSSAKYSEGLGNP